MQHLPKSTKNIAYRRGSGDLYNPMIKRAERGSYSKLALMVSRASQQFAQISDLKVWITIKNQIKSHTENF